MEFSLNFEIIDWKFVDGSSYKHECFLCGQKLKRFYKIDVKITSDLDEAFDVEECRSIVLERTIRVNYDCLKFLPKFNAEEKDDSFSDSSD